MFKLQNIQTGEILATTYGTRIFAEAKADLLAASTWVNYRIVVVTI